jgi:ABC-type Fe3+/spermidine/putrescine transport system ATPase subunit
MSKLKLRGLEKRYGDVAAVAGLDLELREGEFVSLLGPPAAARPPPCA